MQLSLQAKQGVSPFLTTNSEGQMSVGILPVLLELEMPDSPTDKCIASGRATQRP